MTAPKPTFFENAEKTIDPALCAASLRETKRAVYWLDSPLRPGVREPLRASLEADLLVVGGGYTGLWTALQAKERNPETSVVLLEAGWIGSEASGRNGGFCEASLVHGESNGEAHLPKENARLTELGNENLAELIESIERHGIDCDLVREGALAVATEPHQDAWLREEANGEDVVYLDRAQTAELVKSDAFFSGAWSKEDTVLVNPAKLAWGLFEACEKLGVKVFEQSKVTGLEEVGGRITANTAGGAVNAARVALATNVFPSLLKRNALMTVPVYDYVLVTEPLTEAQREAIGWDTLHGLVDLNNRFHYSRPIIDENGGFRILYGGWDAIYRFGGKVSHEYYDSEPTYTKLAAHFFATFPELQELKFSHAWGGAIDSCSRFFSFFDLAYKGKVASCAGFTGLGVGASRFGAKVMLDLLEGKSTELTELEMVKKKPLPFPPEPAAWLGVKMMTAAMARADHREGERGLFLKAMDAVGMGFDS
ncbi:FAD-dependent oxidoreductase [Paeniglutamicibacter psychrophenolicus]|uniref:Glycine/D-amino acid oxidase-like deaminating enzyme n=1 Tax=Paeniglutamicibacter psychrophenolicus TaxID=257454 RepID=A0ABS4W9X2_9MICC|nr:FAD-dependent oxidoreductase [Paeniglutamicibacter psychrophenolicus]MBP2372933.1 glycine/D-amino acid oxidase-like deaminating enzyme [Paeniglutamicibacter psychrophenolicus]